jgi:hypothetical protein
MKRAIAVGAMALALSTAGIGMAQAKAGDPGSHGNAGLCNAYAHNNQHAKDNGQAFVRLAQTAGDYNGDGKMNSDDVLQYCAEQVGTPGGH